MANASNPDSKSTFLSTWKDLVALVRDTLLLALVVLLLAFPTTFNNLLVSAGFEEGSIVGFKWKAKLVESDQALKEAQANITDLTAQNEKLSRALAAAQARSGDPAEKLLLTKLEDENNKLKQASAKVEASVQVTIASNAVLVEKAQTSSGATLQWGVVYGGDTDLAAAQYEVETAAKKYGLTNTSIFFRQGSFRSVATAADRSDAEQLLFKAKNRRSDAYIVNLNTWCPNRTAKAGYTECAVPARETLAR